MLAVRHRGRSPADYPHFLLQYHNYCEDGGPQVEFGLEVSRLGVTALAYRSKYSGESLRPVEYNAEGEPRLVRLAEKKRLREVVESWDQAFLELGIEDCQFAEALP